MNACTKKKTIKLNNIIVGVRIKGLNKKFLVKAPKLNDVT